MMKGLSVDPSAPIQTHIDRRFECLWIGTGIVGKE
jgi:hypothetical protein